MGILAGAIAIALLVTTKPWVAVTEIRGKTDTLDYVRIYGWIAGAINVVLLTLLVVLCPWWARLRKLTPNSPAAVGGFATPRWFWPLVIVAMATTFFYSLPRMTHGFWDDEELNVRTTLWGKFKPNKKTGEVEFVRLGWLETVYGYSKGPNTHTLFSVLARACEEAWNIVAKPKGFPLAEWPFRVPALIFGVLAVAAFAWLLRDFGMPATGVMAAWLLAVHPWSVRYASEARGYSFVIFIVPVVFVFWRRAMLTGSWRWWSAYALAEFSLFYCYPGSAFILIVLNLLTLGLLAAAPECAEPRFAQAGRWFCVNVLAGILALQFMLPLYPQAKLYFDFVSSQGFVSGWQWARNTVAYMIGGAPWTKSGEPWAGYPEWLAAYVDNPVLFWGAASLAITCVALGAFRLLWRSWPSAAFVFVMAICPPITFTVAFFKKFLLYENYVIYSLPGVIICAAAGLTLVGSVLGEAFRQADRRVDFSRMPSARIRPLYTLISPMAGGEPAAANSRVGDLFARHARSSGRRTKGQQDCQLLYSAVPLRRSHGATRFCWRLHCRTATFGQGWRFPIYQHRHALGGTRIQPANVGALQQRGSL